MPGEKIIWISEYKEVIPAQRFKGFFHISNKMRCVSISILSSEPKTEKVGNKKNCSGQWKWKGKFKILVSFSTFIIFFLIINDDIF